MRIDWRTLKDGSLVASSRASGMRYRISDFGDATWLLEGGEVGLRTMERYASKAHAISVVIKALLRGAAERAIEQPATEVAFQRVRQPGNAVVARRRA